MISDIFLPVRQSCSEAGEYQASENMVTKNTLQARPDVRIISHVTRDDHFMRLALQLAQRGYGATSPNPMVGAVLVRVGRIIGHGWHHRAGLPHGEIEALRDAQQQGHSVRGATLYVT